MASLLGGKLGGDALATHRPGQPCLDRHPAAGPGGLFGFKAGLPAVDRTQGADRAIMLLGRHAAQARIEIVQGPHFAARGGDQARDQESKAQM